MKQYVEKFYWPNGRILYDIPYLNFKVHGISRWWFSEGEIHCFKSLKEDEFHGVVLKFEYKSK